MKIYTKAGDKGLTSLYGGKKISKAEIRIDAYGTVDELNSFIGLTMEYLRDTEEYDFLKANQIQLFNVGSHLAAGSDHTFKLPEIKASIIEDLESHIDNMQQQLEPLKNFILPGGSKAVSNCHICRTVARRAERKVVLLDNNESVPEPIIKYLNRLSDYFFVLARYVAKKEGVTEHLWQP